MPACPPRGRAPGADAVSLTDDEDTEAVVRHVLNLLVHHVAIRHAVEENRDLLRELEAYQTECWARDERLFVKHRKLQLGRRPPDASGDAATAAPPPPAVPQSRARGSMPTRLRARTSRTRSGRASSVGRAADDAELLNAPFHALEMASPSEPAFARGGAGMRITAAGAAAKPPTAGLQPQQQPRRGLSARADIATRRADLSAGRAHAAPTPWAWPGAASFAEALLSTPPPASQFEVECGNPLHSQPETLADRVLHRRLSYLGGAQAETCRLERRQRYEGAARGVPSNLVYSAVANRPEWNASARAPAP